MSNKITPNVRITRNYENETPLHLSSILYRGKLMRVFLFRDYAFICMMYRLSGASGKIVLIFVHEFGFIYSSLEGSLRDTNWY